MFNREIVLGHLKHHRSLDVSTLIPTSNFSIPALAPPPNLNLEYVFFLYFPTLFISSLFTLTHQMILEALISQYCLEIPSRDSMAII